MSNLKASQTQLTIIFTIIISVLFLSIGSIFFVFKYIGATARIESEFQKIQGIIKKSEDEILNFFNKKGEKSELPSEDFEKKEIEKILLFTQRLLKDPEGEFGEVDKIKHIEDVLVEGEGDFPFFNQKIVVFQNIKQEKILYSNIEDNLKIDFKTYLEKDEKKQGIIFEKRLAILKIKIGEKISLIFIEREYNQKKLMWDIIYLFFTVSGFSIVFYIIGGIFVKKVLQPVEENIEEMNHFIDNAGHELKTPLAAIQSSSSLMKELKNFEPELIQEIIDETKKTNEIISALRSLAKISKNTKTEVFAIQSVIKNIIVSLNKAAQKNNISLKILNKNDQEITAQKKYFYIMVSNIVSNAIKYNKKGGTVTVEIGEGFIIVTDSGIGIPEKEKNNIFQRFKRLKNHSNIEGFGLGLSMVEKICKIYNWKIIIESIEGVGTKIKIVF